MVEGLPDGLGPVIAANPSRPGPGWPRPGGAGPGGAGPGGAGSGLPVPLAGARLVIIRLLGGRSAFEGLDELLAEAGRLGIPVAAFGGEARLDPVLAELSTVPAGALAGAFEYLVQGGPWNIEQMLRFLSDTVLQTSYGYDPPVVIPSAGYLEQPGPAAPGAPGPAIGIVFYRAHLISGNTSFVEALARAVRERGGQPVPVFCYSLREGSDAGARAVELLAAKRVGAVVTTVLGAGSAGEGSWDPGRLASLGAPIVQAMAATSDREAWRASSMGLGPIDVAMAVAVPELDGRVISVPVSFKEVVDSGDELGSPVVAYRVLPDRVDRVAGLAMRLASLGRKPNAEKKVAIVLSAYPTKGSRLGNAVGLDTPVSTLRLLAALRDAGYRVDRVPASGDELMAELAASLRYGESPKASAHRGEAVAGGDLGRMSAGEYLDAFSAFPAELQERMVAAWGGPPGEVYVEGQDLVFDGIRLGNVIVAIQPPRGNGFDPIAIYHSPDIPPTHHYVAFYRWLEHGLGADAVVHVGKHGTLEWLPGKGVGLSSACFPDAALGDLPLIYPFVVNDPGEGTQAKRRAHAIVVDHLVPPMTRAETYGSIAKLETLLDRHAELAALDPVKLPAIRRQVWDVLVEAEVHRDLGLDQEPGFEGEAFDDLVLEVDGYLCELKDAQIRGGLHVLGEAPSGTALVDMVLAIMRAPQGGVPSLRALVAADMSVELDGAGRAEVDAVEAGCRRAVELLAAGGWRHAAGDRGALGPALGYICAKLVPALLATPVEIGSVLAALAGRFVPPGPSGAPTRGMADVLPTGRNFYSTDPRTVPTRLAYDTGSRLADALVARHVADHGRPPRSVGLVVWGTSAMRTGGDDVAEVLALIGVRPVWEEGSSRVTGFEVVPLVALGRPRVDVTVRMSGFFRDAFPNLVALLDEAFATVASLDEAPDDNPLVANGREEDRIFGPAPGAYGSGVLNVIESGLWHGVDDLAEVYLNFGGWSYGSRGMGVAARGAFEHRLASVEVAAKNQDNREHDIFDSDDYLQDHGGMVAAVRAITGASPAAYFGDSSDPERPRVRSLAEEAARVVRTRVLNPKWISAMCSHGYKGAFELAATVDYVFGYDATAGIVEDWMYEGLTRAYVGDAQVRDLFERSNPGALSSIAERLLEASQRGLWEASEEALATLTEALLEAESWVEGRS
ncbi:MAG: cobaltochelatase subunit CobN [Acidimicrobiales bacterium]